MRNMLRAFSHRGFTLLLLGSGLVFAGQAEWREHMQAAEAAQKRGDSAAATSSFEAAMREAEGFGPRDWRLAETSAKIGANHQGQGRLAEAENHYRRALAIIETTDGPDLIESGRILNNIAVNYLRQRRFADAEPLLKRAIAIAEKAYGPDHLSVATGLNSLGQMTYQQGRVAEAEAFHLRALAIREKARGPEHPLLVSDLGSLAALYFTSGDLAKADSYSARLLTVREKSLGPSHPEVAKSLYELANVRRAQRRLDEAERLYVRALQILKSSSFLPGQLDAATVQLKVDELRRMKTSAVDVVIVDSPSELNELIRRTQTRSADAPQPSQQTMKPAIEEASKRDSAAGLFVSRSRDNPSPLWAGLDATVEETQKDGRVSVFKIHEHEGLTAGNAGRFFICTMFSLAKQRGYVSYINSNPIDGRHAVIFLEKYDEDVQSIIDSGYREYAFFGQLGAKEVALLEQMCAAAIKR